MQCSRVLRVLLMAAVVHSRRVKHLGSATIVLSLSLSVQHNLAPFQRGKLLVLAVILENLAYIQLDIYLQNSIFFFLFHLIYPLFHFFLPSSDALLWFLSLCLSSLFSSFATVKQQSTRRYSFGCRGYRTPFGSACGPRL